MFGMLLIALFSTSSMSFNASWCKAISVGGVPTRVVWCAAACWLMVLVTLSTGSTGAAAAAVVALPATLVGAAALPLPVSVVTVRSGAGKSAARLFACSSSQFALSSSDSSTTAPVSVVTVRSGAGKSRRGVVALLATLVGAAAPMAGSAACAVAFATGVAASASVVSATMALPGWLP